MAIGFAWFVANAFLALVLLQLLSIWLGGNPVGQALGFALQGVSG